MVYTRCKGCGVSVSLLLLRQVLHVVSGILSYYHSIVFTISSRWLGITLINQGSVYGALLLITPIHLVCFGGMNSVFSLCSYIIILCYCLILLFIHDCVIIKCGVL